MCDFPFVYIHIYITKTWKGHLLLIGSQHYMMAVKAFCIVGQITFGNGEILVLYLSIYYHNIINQKAHSKNIPPHQNPGYILSIPTFNCFKWKQYLFKSIGWFFGRISKYWHLFKSNYVHSITTLYKDPCLVQLMVRGVIFHAL